MDVNKRRKTLKTGKDKFMEKINLNEIAKAAAQETLRKRTARTEKFVQNSVIPFLKERAQAADFYTKIHVPADQDIELTKALTEEAVQCEIKIRGRYLDVSWWN